MKSVCLGITLCLLLLQACSQSQESKQATPLAQGGAGTEPKTPPAQGAGPTEAQLAALPASQRCYIQSKMALEKGKPDECFQLLDQGCKAADDEKNPVAYILCRETQARLKNADQDKSKTAENKAEAIKILEETVQKYGSIKDPDIAMRLDLTKFLLAGVNAFNGHPEKSDKIYKETIKEIRNEKPVRHQRLAYCLGNYSEFLAFSKHEKESKQFLAEAKEEKNKADAEAIAAAKTKK